ncbi:pentatricopeptide repeat-containing protein At1g61870, mitochondrial-like [Oryza brachyantha]|uniref:pentatricopeptide repeat-containing protein At1g61870, mitochondrial-like n=1 Tax=Oryza brachyantha TaxID=4533 RepID=UPI001ADD6170|nr:pentatricopeptide repeat-containing protein At1g61870, mitochondrial-like [Oryza brachyantha]
MASLLRRRPRPHPLPAGVPSHLLCRFSALPQVDHPPPTSAPTSTTPASTRASVLDLQLAVRGEADPARIHSLVAGALSNPSEYPRLHASRPLFSLAASRLARLRRPDLAASLLHTLLASAPPSAGLLARAISLFPGPEDALRAFSDSAPSARSDVSLSALLSALLRAGRVEEIKSTVASAESSFGFAPGRASHNVLLHALVKNSELAAARKLLAEMSSKKLKHRAAPDIVSYNTVLAGYSAQGYEQGFEKLLKEINVKKLEPNVVTYNCRIHWFAKKGETFKGEELLDVMESKHVAPNYLTYNALVQGYCKEGNAGAAMRVFKRMKVMKRREGRSDLGVSAHSQTYVVLFRSLVEKERLDDALWVCKSCFAMKAAPPFEAVKGLVEGLVKGGRSAEAKDVVAKMNFLVKGDAKVAWEKIVGELSLEEGTPSSKP